MADRDGNLIETGFADQLLANSKLRWPGSLPASLGIRGVWRDETGRLIEGPSSGARVANPKAKTPNTHGGACPEDLGDLWFEAMHIFPREIDFGQILTTINRSIELVNRYRLTPQDYTALINPVGGLSLTDEPVLPFTILPMHSLVMNLEATTDGPAVFNATLQFTTDPYGLLLPVIGLRVTMFPFNPEAPVTERLLFNTDVIEKLTGQEQRVNLRKAPRQVFELLYKLDEETQRSRFENIVFDWQDKVFGVPVWYEPTTLTAEVLVDDLVLNVGSTAYADYRVDGLVAIVLDDVTFDTLEIVSFTATTITVTSGSINAYPVGTRVYPLRTCYTSKMVSGSRYTVNLAEYQMRFTVENNDVDIQSAAAFSTYNGKVLLDGNNFMPNQTAPSKLEREITVLDSGTGRFRQFGRWDVSRRGSQLGFVVNGSRQQLWEMRQLLHFLKGRQTSFYLPTFQKELTVTANLLDGQAGMDIVNVGYNRFVQQRKPQAILRVVENDGTEHIRDITDSTEVDSTNETLTVGAVWPVGGIAVTDIARVDYYELVRLSTDKIQIEHLSGAGDARMVVPVEAVLD